jgi:hypothetical protein
MSLAAGQIVDEDDLEQVADSSSKKPLVRLVQFTAQSIPNATTTALTFGASSEDIDTNGFHDLVTNNTRVTPTIPGYYRVSVTYAATANTATQLFAVVAKNGLLIQPLVRQTPAATSAAKSVSASAIVSLNGSTDYVEGMCNQNSGGALLTQTSGSVNSVLEVEFLRPL